MNPSGDSNFDPLEARPDDRVGRCEGIGKGGIFSVDDGAATFEGLILADGNADRGGGIVVEDGGTVVLDSVTIRKGQAAKSKKFKKKIKKLKKKLRAL